MKIISHRGNLNGPKPENENSLFYIQDAISANFIVEIDIRYIDGNFYLGHDFPQYKLDRWWIFDLHPCLLFHCKNHRSAIELNDLGLNIHYFCHYSDPFTITSKKYLWIHDLNLSVDENCIIPLITKKDIENYTNQVKIYGICTDYPELLKNGDK